MFVQHLKDLHAHTASGVPIFDTFAEVQQRWHLWRRRYDLFLRSSSLSAANAGLCVDVNKSRDTPVRILSTASEPQPEPTPDLYSQFGRVDGGFLEWNFKIVDADLRAIAHIDRTFRGFGREVRRFRLGDKGKGLIRVRASSSCSQTQVPFP
jgi:hypothetical protein